MKFEVGMIVRIRKADQADLDRGLQDGDVGIVTKVYELRVAFPTIQNDFGGWLPDFRMYEEQMEVVGRIEQ